MSRYSRTYNTALLINSTKVQHYETTQHARTEAEGLLLLNSVGALPSSGPMFVVTGLAVRMGGNVRQDATARVVFVPTGEGTNDGPPVPS